MNPDTYEQNKDRPAWVRRHRDELQELTGLAIPRSLPAVADWLDGYQSHLTKRMRAYFDTETEIQTDETDSQPTDGGDDS